jgi:hypothetical protein
MNRPLVAAADLNISLTVVPTRLASLRFGVRSPDLKSLKISGTEHTLEVQGCE